MPGKDKGCLLGLDSLILMEDEDVIMGDGDDTLEQAPAPSVVKDDGGNDAVSGAVVFSQRSHTMLSILHSNGYV